MRNDCTMAKRTKLERVDMEIAKLIDDMIKTSLRHIDTTRIIAKKYKTTKQNNQQDYGGFI